jgi:hypothetical protein
MPFGSAVDSLPQRPYGRRHCLRHAVPLPSNFAHSPLDPVSYPKHIFSTSSDDSDACASQSLQLCMPTGSPVQASNPVHHERVSLPFSPKGVTECPD